MGGYNSCSKQEHLRSSITYYHGETKHHKQMPSYAYEHAFYGNQAQYLPEHFVHTREGVNGISPRVASRCKSCMLDVQTFLVRAFSVDSELGPQREGRLTRLGRRSRGRSSAHLAGPLLCV